MLSSKIKLGVLYEYLRLDMYYICSTIGGQQKIASNFSTVCVLTILTKGFKLTPDDF